MALDIFPGLPRTDRLPKRRHLLLRALRHPVSWLMTHYWDVVITGAENLPAGGPMILVGNHAGLIDGPLLVVLHPQPTFALAKVELFSGPLGKLLEHGGQISIDRRRADPAGIRRSIHLLRNAGVLAIFPEGKRTAGRVSHAGRGAAYLAMVTGAPVVPVALLGTRLPGQPTSHIPGRGSLIDISYGRPMYIPAVGWPRTKLAVAEWTERIRLELSNHVVARQQLTGLSLPRAAARKQMKTTS
jgi:1-acyl-sn-glycerol-3-phosphate acyltransferase